MICCVYAVYIIIYVSHWIETKMAVSIIFFQTLRSLRYVNILNMVNVLYSTRTTALYAWLFTIAAFQINEYEIEATVW